MRPLGLNVAAAMLRPGRLENAGTSLAEMLRHIRDLADRLDIDCVALGSDLDGTTIPEAIGDASGHPAPVQALRDDGFAPSEVAAATTG